jgi:hypothetical protein
MKKKHSPKYVKQPKGDQIKIALNPDSYLQETPVWRFCDFDWDGPWGLETCSYRIRQMQTHIQQHLSSFETMTWAEILKASGGKGAGKGNNSHEIPRDKFKKEAIERLKKSGIKADTIFSLRLDAGTRIYGVREGRCLRITFFDPHHKDHDKCAYQY